jgi:hypothetical protein
MTTQDLSGHKYLKTTMIFTYVFNRVTVRLSLDCINPYIKHTELG